MSNLDMEKARRETNRWLILQCLNCARPIGASEALIISALSDTVPISNLELRRELDYLESRELIEIANKGGASWHAKLVRTGIDVVEYTVSCDPGIARPPKYW
jgi:hypothetical protein